MDTAVKYLTDFASKTNQPGHINISDVENVLYITGKLPGMCYKWYAS